MAGVLEKYLDGLLMNMKGADEFRMTPPCGARDMWDTIGDDARQGAIRRADHSYLQPLLPISLDQYVQYSVNSDQSDYTTAYFSRRAALVDQVVGVCAANSTKYIPEIARIVWAICEESSWVLPSSNALLPGGDALPDIFDPLIDRYAARTAADLSMAVSLIGDMLDSYSPRITRRVEYEIERRIVEPFLKYEDIGWMLGPRGDLAACLWGVALSFLTFEYDDRRRWHCMRRAWRLADRILAQQAFPDGSISGGLAEWQSFAGYMIDIINMALIATGGAVDARSEAAVDRLLKFPVSCHLARGYFVNPGEHLMRPGLNGIELYRIGMAAHDAYLCDLGAYIHKIETRVLRLQNPSLLQASFEALTSAVIEAESLNQPLIPQVYLGDAQLMLARSREGEERGMAFSMHGGDNGVPGCHLDIGDISLFLNGSPILVDIGSNPKTQYHNLPTVGGIGQRLGSSFRSTDANCQWNREYAVMTLDLTGAYPPEAGVESWQRSAVFSFDGALQLIDLVDLSRPAPIEFHFISAVPVTVSESHAQLDAVRLKWDESLTCEVARIELSGDAARLWSDGLYRITLRSTRPDAMGGRFAFSFREITTYGS